MHRRLTLLALSLLAAGCTSTEFKPLTFPDSVVLQEAPPEMAIVYLIRAPHDSATLPVYIDERKVVVLPPASYSVVVLPPGTYNVASSVRGTSTNAPASSLTLQAGERRFLYTSARTGTGIDLSALAIGAIVARGDVPIVMPTVAASGARTWKECSELDAQGLMSIAKLVLPVKGAV